MTSSPRPSPSMSSMIATEAPTVPPVFGPSTRQKDDPSVTVCEGVAGPLPPAASLTTTRHERVWPGA